MLATPVAAIFQSLTWREIAGRDSIPPHKQETI